MSKRTDDDETLLPFPVAPVSNGEWCPLPITDKQRLAAKLIIEETGAGAKRHGMSRAKFLRTAAATTIAFAVLNKVNGLDQSGEASALPMKKVHCDDLAAARERLDKKDIFIIDVQQHHVDLAAPGAANACFLDFRPDLHPGIPCPQGIGQGQYIKDVFVDSHTTIGDSQRPAVRLPDRTRGHGRDARPGERARRLGAVHSRRWCATRPPRREPRPRSRPWSTR